MCLRNQRNARHWRDGASIRKRWSPHLGNPLNTFEYNVPIDVYLYIAFGRRVRMRQNVRYGIYSTPTGAYKGYIVKKNCTFWLGVCLDWLIWVSYSCKYLCDCLGEFIDAAYDMSISCFQLMKTVYRLYKNCFIL